MADLIGRWLVASLTLLAVLWLLAGQAVKAQDDHHHPPQDADAHETFYRHLTRPDWPEPILGSCCGKGDCYSAPARFRNGHWQALRREDRVWITIPENKIVTRDDELARRPDQQATLCALPHFTYCFVPPQSGI